jgi:hypothetical protein
MRQRIHSESPEHRAGGENEWAGMPFTLHGKV